MKPMNDVGLDLGKWLGGAAAGALLMYLLDPDRGSERRAGTTGKLRDASRQGSSMLGNAWETVSNRVSSAAETASDSASRLARSVGTDDAADAMGDTVSRLGVRGSDKLADALGDTVSRASQVATEAKGRMKQALGGRDEWVPGVSNSALVSGGLLGLYGLMRRSPLAMMLGLAGVAMIARGVAKNQPMGSMLRGRSLGKTIDLEKTVFIDAAPEDVYDMWSNYENFPRFMSHVVEVRDLGRRRSHWVVRGPAGSEFEWNSVLTEQSRPHRLAWRSEPDAEIGQSGSVQFESHRGGTRVTVRMSYSPPAGALGHGIATLLGADPKRQMDDDLARMKALIERGPMPQDLGKHGSLMSRFLH
jgi:uncharacterized membrane protein/gas vesicle protein